MKRLIASNSELALAVISHLLEHKLELAEKVEMLCLHDVEYRILHYLAELSKLVKPLDTGEGYPLPITQLELADLIGATRETTSTTLNQLERRGLLEAFAAFAHHFVASLPSSARPMPSWSKMIRATPERPKPPTWFRNRIKYF